MRRNLTRLLVVGMAAGALVAGLSAPASATPQGRDRTVGGWIGRNAVPLASTDPRDPLDDLRPLRQIVGGATVVGLGESTHGSHEQFRAKHRMVRFLVERMGFRTVALEDDFAGGIAIDRYVLTGEGDPRELVTDLSTPYLATEEILDLVRWMRSYNETHHDKVRYLGSDLLALRQLSFDEVIRYVRRVAPDRLDELQGYLAPVRPTLDRNQHLVRYLSLPDNEKRPLIDSARRASRLVHGLASTAPRLAREYAEQHARTIVGWHENYANDGFASEREQFIADTIGWWQRITGSKIAYWAANAHSSAAPTVTFRLPWASVTGTFAGGYLRDRLGRRYVSIGTFFGSGTVTSGIPPNGPSPQPVAPPAPGLLDATLGGATAHDYLLDLHAPAPHAVRQWLGGPMTMRMVHPLYVAGQDANAHNMSVESLIGAFDALVYLRSTTNSRLLA